MNKEKLNEAIEYYRKSLEIQLKTIGKDHHDTAYSYNNIGVAFMNQGKLNEAIDNYQKCYEILLKTDDPKTKCIEELLRSLREA